MYFGPIWELALWAPIAAQNACLDVEICISTSDHFPHCLTHMLPHFILGPVTFDRPGVQHYSASSCLQKLEVFWFSEIFLLEYQTGQNILVNDYQILLQVRHLPATTSRSNRTRARAPNINTVSPARGHADPNTRVCVCNSSKHTRVLTNWTAKNERNREK